MNIIKFLLKSSWLNIIIATTLGGISGLCNARLIAFINDAVNNKSTSVQVFYY